MISFIIIGKNVEYIIYKTIKSVYTFISQNELQKSEVIYVDSNSIDKSIEIASQFAQIKIIRLSGELNAAIARNEGAKLAKGDVLFFIDGDMEIIPKFFESIFQSNHKLKYPFVTGEYKEIFYTFDKKHILDDSQSSLIIPPNSTYKELTTGGGLFVIQKKYWIHLEGMDSMFNRNEDLDFSFRMLNEGYILRKYNQYLAIHHTVSYYDSMKFKSLLNEKMYHFSGLLLRKHIFKRRFLTYFIRYHISLFILLLAIMISVVSSPFFFLSYPIILLLKGIKKQSSHSTLSMVMLSRFYHDILIVWSFITYWPKKKVYSVENIE